MYENFTYIILIINKSICAIVTQYIDAWRMALSHACHASPPFSKILIKNIYSANFKEKFSVVVGNSLAWSFPQTTKLHWTSTFSSNFRTPCPWSSVAYKNFQVHKKETKFTKNLFSEDSIENSFTQYLKYINFPTEHLGEKLTSKYSREI